MFWTKIANFATKIYIETEHVHSTTKKSVTLSLQKEIRGFSLSWTGSISVCRRVARGPREGEKGENFLCISYLWLCKGEIPENVFFPGGKAFGTQRKKLLFEKFLSRFEVCNVQKTLSEKYLQPVRLKTAACTVCGPRKKHGPCVSFFVCKNDHRMVWS